MAQKKIRRSYSNEFKRNAVELSEHPGRQVNEVAEKLGITEQILTRWRREHRRRGELSFPGNGRQAFNKEQTRIRELEKQLRAVEMERNIFIVKATGSRTHLGLGYKQIIN